MGDDKQLAQEHAGLIWNIFYAICSAIVTGIVMLIRISHKIKNAVSRDELAEKYVSKETFNAFQIDLKDDLNRIEKRQLDSDAKGDRHYTNLVGLIVAQKNGGDE